VNHGQSQESNQYWQIQLHISVGADEYLRMSCTSTFYTYPGNTGSLKTGVIDLPQRVNSNCFTAKAQFHSTSPAALIFQATGFVIL